MAPDEKYILAWKFQLTSPQGDERYSRSIFKCFNKYFNSHPLAGMNDFSRVTQRKNPRYFNSRLRKETNFQPLLDFLGTLSFQLTSP